MCVRTAVSFHELNRSCSFSSNHSMVNRPLPVCRATVLIACSTFSGRGSLRDLVFLFPGNVRYPRITFGVTKDASMSDG